MRRSRSLLSPLSQVRSSNRCSTSSASCRAWIKGSILSWQGARDTVELAMDMAALQSEPGGGYIIIWADG